MTGVERAAQILRDYDGPPVRIMEVCGTHTAALFKTGIRSILSDKIQLISGPGCPVCVTSRGTVDRLLHWALTPGCTVLSFGDMLKVPGVRGSLMGLRGEGANFRMIYSPLQALEWAEREPETTFVVAAVGFETTAPAYAMLVEQARQRGIGNIKLMCALKAILPAMEFICTSEAVDGFLCPGHVSTVIGADAYADLSQRYGKPMCVAGFDAEHLLAAVYEIVEQINGGKPSVRNLYPEAVTAGGNPRAQELLRRVFEPGNSHWRGIGSIPLSGLFLREEFSEFDGGSRVAETDDVLEPGCRCADVLVGRIHPNECPLFGRTCSPENPHGACMVSDEGACGVWHRNTGGRQ